MIDIIIDEDTGKLDLEQMIDWTAYQIENLEYDKCSMSQFDFAGSSKEDDYVALKNILDSLNELKGWRG